MQNRILKILLAAGVIVPLVLLLWPFAQWDGVMAVVLRILPAFCGQALLCGMGKHRWLKAVLPVLTGLLFLWGVYLFFASPHWSDATVGGLLADYAAPLMGCAAACILCRIKTK